MLSLPEYEVPEVARGATDCAYCSASASIAIPCLAVDNGVRGTCRAAKRTWYTEGYPSRIGFLAVVFLGLYIIVYSPGMGSVPWIINSGDISARVQGSWGRDCGRLQFAEVEKMLEKGYSPFRKREEESKDGDGH
ncbi:inositol transporter [Striga asiatica]|uniref:Inositol transporter n=1 Tax=Striga asiatica TaxID=4170 RepID=A0A5A7R1Z9_STRAF|nr:inositol transporter [Striga asiatica]